MPAYLLKDGVGTSVAPFPGRNGRPDFDWSRLDGHFGRALVPSEKEQVARLLLFYAVQMADDFHAPSVPDLLDVLNAIEKAAGDPVALDKLLRQPTDSPALHHARWELFWAPTAPSQLSPGWLQSVRAKRRRLQDRQDHRLYHRSKPDPIKVEGPDGVWRAVKTEPERSLREIAFAGLVEGLGGVWKDAGLVVTVRKDDQKALHYTPSPFILFLDALLSHLPQAYRRNGITALSTAVSKVLQRAKATQSGKQDPT